LTPLNLGQSPSEKCELEDNSISPASLELAKATTAISAGETIVFSDSNGTFATLTVVNELGEISYDSDSVINSLTLPAIPNGLIIDIPGDDFPALTNIAVPNASAITDFSFPGTNPSSTTEFTWTPSGVPGVFLKMSIETNPGTDESAYLDCTMADDGSYSLVILIEALCSTYKWSTQKIFEVARLYLELTDQLTFKQTHNKSIDLLG